MIEPSKTRRLPSSLASSLLLAALVAACQQQTPANSAPPPGITAPAPPANPQPDVNIAPTERASPPVLKAEALGEFEPGNPVASAITGKLDIQDTELRGENGASFTTERVAIVKGGDEYSAGATYAQALQIDAGQPVELRRVLQETPPTATPANAICGGDRAGYIALAKVEEGGDEVVRLMGLKGTDLPAAKASGIALCAIAMYLKPAGARTANAGKRG